MKENKTPLPTMPDSYDQDAPASSTINTPPTPEPIQPPIQPLSQIPAKPNNYLVIILSVFLIITVVIVGLFYFQIQKLSKELSKYQALSSPTPTATPDPTANWKTYTSDKFGFSFSYPKELGYIYDQLGEYRETGNNNAMILLQNYDGVNKSGEEPQDFQIVIYVGNLAGQYNLPNPEGSQIKDVINGVDVIKTSTTQKWVQVPTVIFMSKPNKIAVQLSTPTSSNKLWFDQILSTFKFLGATSSANPASTQKACTLEAKVCPDGSSVGRTGPNCEFAPCP